MAKLPGIVQQPVGEFASGNIQQPNYKALGDAQMGLLKMSAQAIATVYATNQVADVDEATASAAGEISELRAKLENNNTLDFSEVPENMLAEMQMVVSDGEGGRREVSRPKVFTHEVAEGMWRQGSDEIVQHYAGQIKDKKARNKFITEMTERYLVPGTLAIAKVNATRLKMYGQANAQRAFEEIAATNAPTEVREQQMTEIIARQLLLGADPVWAENLFAEIGPMVDQIDVQNRIMAATTVDQVDQAEEDMWTVGNRLSPEQMRTLSSQMDARRRDFRTEHLQEQTETADNLFVDFVNDELTNEAISGAVASDSITREAAWTLYNALNKGTTTTASEPFTLSHFRGEIFKLQYTGGEGNLRVTDKAKLLKLQISRGAMGLNPNGTPTGLPATVTGEDAFRLNKDVDAAVKLALENEEYKNAFANVLMWTGAKLDLEGQIVTGLGGDQDQVEAAIAFKTALDNYMNTYGADAKPSDFFEANKEAYDPRNFSSGINGSYLKAFPQSEQFMTRKSPMEIEFSSAQQENYILWLNDNAQTLGQEKYNAMSALFDQYYRGKGIAPGGGALMLEPDDPLYRQFQQMIPDVDAL